MSQGPIPSLMYGLFGSIAKALAVNSDGSLVTAQEQSAGYFKAPAGATTPLGTGAVGDTIDELIYVPGTTAAGVVNLIDGSGGSSVTLSLFVGGGTTALTDLRPVVIPLRLKSTKGGWSIQCGANITAVATGKFTP